MKKINVICPTFRSREDTIIRKIGIYYLIKSVISKKNIRLCIIDSSPKPLEIFERGKSIYRNIIYIHTPNKEEAIKRYKKIFPQAMDFCITDNHQNLKKYLEIVKAWDYFIPWDEGYPVELSLEKQFLSSRPSIGMKRNMAIAALEETFGAGDIVCYADDDDFRDENYFSTMSNLIRNYDYIRISKWLTCNFREETTMPICGFHDLKLHKDANNYWIPGISKDVKLYNSQTNESYDLLVKNRYSKLKCLAFSPISYEGAMHVFSMNLWKIAVKYFGGIPSNSMSEDVLFFTQCKNFLGNEFHPYLVRNKNFNFLRCAHNNTSVIEWTASIKLDEMPKWAREKIQYISILLRSPQKLDKFQNDIKELLIQASK